MRFSKHWLWLLLAQVSFAGPYREQYEGTAKDSQGQIVYLEKHEVVYDAPPPHGRAISAKTTYLNPDGSLRAELNSDFKGPSFLPSYSFKDHRLKVNEGVICCRPDSTLEVFHQEKRKTVRFDADWVSGQGFHYFSRDSLEKLVSGEKRLLQFLIPSRLDHFSFRIRKGESETLAQNQIQVVLEVQNWILRLFAPKIIATYDRSSRRLLSYLGPSNLLTDQSDVQTVSIDYRY